MGAILPKFGSSFAVEREVRPLAKVRRRTLTEEVYEALKEDILSRRLRRGTRLVESRLAGEFGVSKTPVREAISRLEREGLVDFTPHHGAVVSRLSAKQVEDLMELREALEGFGAEKAATRITAEQLEALDQLVVRGGEALKEGDLERYKEVDLQFHRLIQDASGNERLSMAIAGLEDQIRMVMSTSVQLKGRADSSVEEHRSIYAALERRDPEAAASAARQHIARARDAILAHLRLLRDE